MWTKCVSAPFKLERRADILPLKAHNSAPIRNGVCWKQILLIFEEIIHVITKRLYLIGRVVKSSGSSGHVYIYTHTHHLHTHWILQTLNPWVSMIVHCYSKPSKLFFCIKDVSIQIFCAVFGSVLGICIVLHFFLFNIMEFLNIFVHFMSSELEYSNLISISVMSFDCFEYQVLVVLISEQI